MNKGLQLLPYVTFNSGRCREAMEYYQQVLGGELTFKYFKELYPDLPAADQEKVMHSELANDDLSIMGSDTIPGHEAIEGDNVSVTITGRDVPKLGSIFTKLSEGGTVVMPFEKQVWGQELGMFTDKFGVHWLVSVRA